MTYLGCQWDPLPLADLVAPVAVKGTHIRCDELCILSSMLQLWSSNVRVHSPGVEFGPSDRNTTPVLIHPVSSQASATHDTDMTSNLIGRAPRGKIISHTEATAFNSGLTPRLTLPENSVRTWGSPGFGAWNTKMDFSSLCFVSAVTLVNGEWLSKIKYT